MRSHGKKQQRKCQRRECVFKMVMKIKYIGASGPPLLVKRKKRQHHASVALGNVYSVETGYSFLQPLTAPSKGYITPQNRGTSSLAGAE